MIRRHEVLTYSVTKPLTEDIPTDLQYDLKGTDEASSITEGTTRQKWSSGPMRLCWKGKGMVWVFDGTWWRLDFLLLCFQSRLSCSQNSNELTFQLQTARKGIVRISFVWDGVWLAKDFRDPSLSRRRNHLVVSLKPGGFKLRGLIPHQFLRLFQLPDYYQLRINHFVTLLRCTTCKTNTNQWLTSQLTTEQQGLIEETNLRRCLIPLIERRKEVLIRDLITV
jgi:hypothetical protein